jgi:hypothetical protein
MVCRTLQLSIIEIRTYHTGNELHPYAMHLVGRSYVSDLLLVFAMHVDESAANVLVACLGS